LGAQAQGKATANLQLPDISRAEAAELLNVSERTINAAAKVKDEGAPARPPDIVRRRGRRPRVRNAPANPQKAIHF
jgi:hypothetical protein